MIQQCTCPDCSRLIWKRRQPGDPVPSFEHGDLLTAIADDLDRGLIFPQHIETLRSIAKALAPKHVTAAPAA